MHPLIIPASKMTNCVNSYQSICHTGFATYGFLFLALAGIWLVKENQQKEIQGL